MHVDVGKGDETCVRAFEMKTLNIDIESVMQTNKWVMKKAEKERSVMESTVSRKLSFFSHIVRNSRDCLEKEIVRVPCQEQEHKEGHGELGWIT